jgi:hypothetical protein
MISWLSYDSIDLLRFYQESLQNGLPMLDFTSFIALKQSLGQLRSRLEILETIIQQQGIQIPDL